MSTRNLSQLDRAQLGLRSLILGGGFVEGQRLSEVAVAKQLGTSRTPLRQAMDRLVAEGLLERIETGGCRVAVIGKDDIADAIELRGVIEGTAARLAAERGVDQRMLKQASEALDLIDRALDAASGLDFDLYVKQNAEFHALLAKFPNSSLIQREAERLKMLPLASPSAFLSEQAMIPDFEDSLRFAQRQHRAIMDAIINKEGARAEALAREHARLALTNFEYLSENRAQLASSIPRFALGVAKPT
ncbi:GntR family transcriptional regulator [Tateyamaria sp. SN3-11]|uniref:GntR family transcriptional regulator n=1 Tax=Tateyamaria sp. SN3-11 TaxID=3092147 RepID=UPI0039ECFA94